MVSYEKVAGSECPSGFIVYCCSQYLWCFANAVLLVLQPSRRGRELVVSLPNGAVGVRDCCTRDYAITW